MLFKDKFKYSNIFIGPKSYGHILDITLFCNNNVFSVIPRVLPNVGPIVSSSSWYSEIYSTLDTSPSLGSDLFRMGSKVMIRRCCMIFCVVIV